MPRVFKSYDVFEDEVYEFLDTRYDLKLIKALIGDALRMCFSPRDIDTNIKNSLGFSRFKKKLIGPEQTESIFAICFPEFYKNDLEYKFAIVMEKNISTLITINLERNIVTAKYVTDLSEIGR